MSYFPATLHRVIDGDTIVLDIHLRPFKILLREPVRLVGVDTAEIYGVPKTSKPYQDGIQHKEFVEGWLEDAADPLAVRIDGEGKYGRWLGEVYNEKNESLNQSLIDEFDVQSD